MCELQWYALAEIHLRNQDKSREIYCLCSRVFIRTRDDSLKRHASSAELSASEEELLIDDEASSECNSLPTISRNKIKQDVEHETVSCYCSASHTDNLSTDEHDSLRDSHDARAPFKGLQSSDSGADLTECIRHDLDADWQRYWSANGEKLIWESWIGKYSAYINPDYLQYAQDQAEADDEDVQPKGDKFSFDKRDLLTLDIEAVSRPDVLRTIDENSPLPPGEAGARRGDSEVKNRILIRNLSGSDDRLNVEVSEGWNPLSPISVDCETEIEQLLSSRCGSHASSSLRTVDSMTNVTRMTISSLDLSQSSHSSESFSSVSSVQSSLSSTSSEETEEDYQHQWNVLWKKHYEEEYLRHYTLFVVSWKEQNINDLSASDVPNRSESFLDGLSTERLTKRNLNQLFQGRVDDDVRSPIEVSDKVANSLGDILNSIKMSGEENTSRADFAEPDDDQEEMAALGLPVAFGGGTKRSRTARNDPADSLSTSPASDFESSRKRMKTAFNQIGLEYDDSCKEQLAGPVQYRTKHLRMQNRHLRLRPDYQKPRHIYYDDDGKEIPETETPDDVEFQSVLLDSSDSKQSSGDEEIVSGEIVTTPPKAEEQPDEAALPKRKKRKKKLQVPPEIKENPHLRKYWNKRFTLFSKFDEGIKLDEESWYSVTPEKLAKHTAERCRCDVIVDGFCGAGGNTIQFAFTCRKVIAVDIDPKKIELARHNAKIYGVADRIEFVVGDFLKLADTLEADAVFLSPPWGGPSYLKKAVYDLESMLLPVPIGQLLETARKISSNIAVFLPRNSNSFVLIDETKPGGGVEIEQNFMKQNLVAITAYYNDLIKKIKV